MDSMTIVLIWAAGFVSVVIILLILKVAVSNRASAKAAMAEAVACEQAKSAATKQREKIDQSIEKLRGMKERYWVNNILIIHEGRLRVLGNDLNLAKTVAAIEKIADEYREVQANLDEYCNTPEITLKPKYYDPLTDIELQFEVKLKINHPEKGELFLMVNPETAERYARWGGVAFAWGLISARSESHCSLVKGAGLCGEYEDGFALLAFYPVHQLVYDVDRRIPKDSPILKGQDSAFLGQYYCYGQTIREVIAVPSLDPMSEENVEAKARADAEAEQLRIAMMIEAAEADRLREIEIERLAKKEAEDRQWEINNTPFPDDDPDAPYPW